MPHPPVSSESIDAALTGALERDEGRRVYGRGDLADAFEGGNVLRGHYRAGPAASAPLETLTATARLGGDRLEIWAPTQAPGLARAAAARVAGLGEAQVTLYPTLAGGGYGRKLETRAIEQAAMLAMRAQAAGPAHLVAARGERPGRLPGAGPGAIAGPARQGGIVLGWQARIAAPDTGAQLAARLRGGAAAMAAIGDPVAGAVPPYAIPAVAVDYLPAETGIRIGGWRSGAHSYTAFFTESFMDELARLSGVEPLSFRMQMLGDNPRLARCLTTAATFGGWDGGAPGSAMGIACHSAFGSHIATLVEVEVDRRAEDPGAARGLRGRLRADRQPRPRPAAGRGRPRSSGSPPRPATRSASSGGRPDVRGFDHFGFPTLAALARRHASNCSTARTSRAESTELAVPTAAPAIANALHAADRAAACARFR